MKKVSLTNLVLRCAMSLFVLAGTPALGQVITEFSTGISTGARPESITLDPDGNLWFTEIGLGAAPPPRIGKITPAGTVTEFPTGLLSPLLLGGIASGPDGNVWFIDSSISDRIAKITPAGVVTAFPIPNAGGGRGPVRSITRGPDGNLWFTEFGANRIGRITPAGAILEFGAGISANAGISGIASGSDGNLWFSEQSTNRVATMTPAGVVQEFSAGISANAAPVGITAGRDGNLWFIEVNLDQIGRITPAGVVTEFAAGITPGAGLSQITAGPDGNMWFTENKGNRIGRITPAGVVTEFSTGLSANAGLSGIAAGPGGDLWFAEVGANKVGRITTGAPPSIAMAFGAFSIPLNGSTSLTFTIGNPNASTTLTGIFVTDSLPSGLVVATPSGVTNDCGGTVILDGAVALAGGSVPPAGSCTFRVNVKGTTPGGKINTTGPVDSIEGRLGGTAEAVLFVAAPPTIRKAFGAATVPLNTPTTLTFTVDNPAEIDVSGVAFVDTLPPGLVVATPNGLTGTCGGGAITAPAGSAVVSLAGASLPTGFALRARAPLALSSCTFSVNVVGTTAGVKRNVTGNVSSTEGSTGGTAAATLNVAGPPSFTSPASTTFTPDSASTFTVRTNGYPIPTITSTGSLPAGVSYVDNKDGTATLAGKPGADAVGIYRLTFAAANGTAPDAVQAFLLIVGFPAPQDVPALGLGALAALAMLLAAAGVIVSRGKLVG